MDLLQEALLRFQEEFRSAATCGLEEPTAVAVATAGSDARPTVRTVLLKSADERGFVFYTNVESRKGQNVAENPRAAMCFYWGPLEKQVIVEGDVSRVSDEEADAYWATRPRESQIGAWASLQSRPLTDRLEFQERFATFAQEFATGPIPRPPFWTGLRVVPDRIEFWQGISYRLHERTLYEKASGEWIRSLLYP